MDSPLISILMPVYNAERHLTACVQSILAQSDRHWELIAVDDQSLDQSGDLLSAFAQQDSRIQCYRTSQKGIIPALRLALEHSKGQLISRMDADDLMAPQKLAQLKTLLLHHGPGHVSTGLVRYFSEEGLKEGYQKYEQWLNQLSRDNRHYEAIYRECVLPSPCWMAWRSDLLSCGAFDSPHYPEDYDLCFRFYRQGLRIVAADQVLHHWRDHSSRTSRNDPKYANIQYFDLKLPYFLELDHQKERPLVLWGAGKKGKLLTRKLKAVNVKFHWITNNPKKQGLQIDGILMKPETVIEELDRPQIIIAVAAPEGQKSIQKIMDQKSWMAGKDYFFFC